MPAAVSLPRYVFGPKPKRRTELGLLLFAALLVVALYIIAVLGQKSKIPDNIGVFLGVVLGLALCAHMANRWLAPMANAVILPLAVLLNGIGYVVIARWDPGQAQGQAAWAALGIGLYVLTLLVVRYSRDLERYRYLLLLVAGIFLVVPLFFSPIGGARLWVHYGNLSFQPIEFSKILLCIYFASYFAENKEMLTIPRRRSATASSSTPGRSSRSSWPGAPPWPSSGSRTTSASPRCSSSSSSACSGSPPGRVGYLVLGLVLFGVGAYIAARYFGQVHLRVTEWQNPWPTATNQNAGGYQLSQGWYSMGTGGIGGTGLGFDHYAYVIPELTSDMIFAAIGTEMGLVGCVAVVMAFILLVGSGFRVAQTARSDFSRLMATGLTLILGFQAFFIMAGVVRLLPFTGITLPFVAYGGSSLLANYVLIALMLRISDEGAEAQAAMLAAGSAGGPGERPMVPAG